MSKKQKTGGTEEEFTDIAQHGLDSIKADGPIWTHFSNSQRTRLRWRATVFNEQIANWVSGLHPFGQMNISTATSLNTTGGGAIAEGSSAILASDTTNVGYDFSTPFLTQVRMTSPYNILKGIGGYTAATKSEPNWIAVFDSKYQYYQVQETDWGITLNFGKPRLSAEPPTIMGAYQNHKLKIFWRYTNQDDPPIKYTYSTNRLANVGAFSNNVQVGGQITSDRATPQAVTVANNTINLTSDDYERMGGWKCKTVSFNTTHATTVHLGGRYKFGQCKMDIKTIMPTDAAGAQATPTAEGMTLSNATPAFPEILSVIIVNDYSTCQRSSVTIPFSISYDTNQAIDWCDLRANFKFPTPNCNETNATSNVLTEEQFFTRGANAT